MKKKIIIVLLIFLLPVFVYSQVILTGNLYGVNKYATNPAYAGINNMPHIFLSYRKISSTFDGVPELLNIGVSSPFYSNMSLGIRFFKQSEGLFSTNIGFIDYSYKLTINEDHTFRFGISGGINSNKLNSSEIIADDPSAIIDVASKNFEQLHFESSIGFVYQWKRFEWSLAIPKLFDTKNNVKFSFNSFVTYNFSVAENKIDLNPGFMINYMPNNPYLYDICLEASLNRQFWIGFAYRNRPAISISSGFNFKNMGIAYATEISTSKLVNLYNQIHEISISYGFRRKEKVPNDTLISPIQNLIAKSDSIEKDSIKNIELVENNNVDIQENTDTLTNKESDFKYKIVEAGEGVYVIQPITLDSTYIEENNNLFSFEDEMISEQDSNLALNLVKRIEKRKEQNEDFKLVEIGDGIFTLKSNQQQTDSIDYTDNEAQLLDSLFKEKKMLSNIDKKDKNPVSKVDATNYYSLLLYINESNKDLLLNANITDQIRLESDSHGELFYYYGYFENEEDANSYQKKFIKYKNLKTEIVRFSLSQ